MLAVADALSVTVMVAVPAAPAAVGVPEMTPAVLMVIPAGRPVALNVYGVVPPDTPGATLMFVIAIPSVEAGMSYAELSINVRGVPGAVIAP